MSTKTSHSRHRAPPNETVLRGRRFADSVGAQTMGLALGGLIGGVSPSACESAQPANLSRPLLREAGAPEAGSLPDSSASAAEADAARRGAQLPQLRQRCGPLSRVRQGRGSRSADGADRTRGSLGTGARRPSAGHANRRHAFGTWPARRSARRDRAVAGRGRGRRRHQRPARRDARALSADPRGCPLADWPIASRVAGRRCSWSCKKSVTRAPPSLAAPRSSRRNSVTPSSACSPHAATNSVRQPLCVARPGLRRMRSSGQSLRRAG